MLFIHEFLWGILLGGIVLAALLMGEWSSGAVLGLSGILAVLVVVRLLAGRQRQGWRWRMRLLIWPGVIVSTYFLLGPLTTSLRKTRADALLRKIDLVLLGEDASLLLQPWEFPVLTEFFALCYVLFFVQVLGASIWYALRSPDIAERFTSGLFGLYATGYAGYVLFSAAGPHLAWPHISLIPLEGGWTLTALMSLVGTYANRIDAFPSLHCGILVYIALLDRRYRPRMATFSLIFCMLVSVSAVWLRYHYVIDLIVGGGMAVLWALWALKQPTADSPHFVYQFARRRDDDNQTGRQPIRTEHRH